LEPDGATGSVDGSDFQNERRTTNLKAFWPRRIEPRKGSQRCGDRLVFTNEQIESGRCTMMAEGGDMGDKGGKKDKEKNKQQRVTKQKQDDQKKQDKARPRTPA
jgi:hypothetical protein